MLLVEQVEIISSILMSLSLTFVSSPGALSILESFVNTSTIPDSMRSSTSASSSSSPSTNCGKVPNYGSGLRLYTLMLMLLMLGEEEVLVDTVEWGGCEESLVNIAPIKQFSPYDLESYLLIEGVLERQNRLRSNSLTEYLMISDSTTTATIAVVRNAALLLGYIFILISFTQFATFSKYSNPLETTKLVWVSVEGSLANILSICATFMTLSSVEREM